MGQSGRSLSQNVPRLVARLASTVKAALFDLDGTLLPGTSAEKEFIRFALKTGNQTAPAAVRAFLSWVVHIPTRGLQSNKTYFGGVNMDLLAETAETFCRQQLTHHIPDQAQRLITAHRAAGDCLGIVSGAPEILIAPLKDLLDLDFVVGTKLTCEQGRLTGDLDGPRVSGSEKVCQSEEVARTIRIRPPRIRSLRKRLRRSLLASGSRSSRRGQSRQQIGAAGSQEGLADLYLLLKDNLKP